MEGSKAEHKTRKYIVAGAGLVLLIAFCVMPPFGGMERQAMRVLGAVLCAICFWASDIWADWITSLGLLILWASLCGFSFPEAAKGYTSESLWLVTCAFCLAEAVDRTGFFRRVAWGIIRMFKPTFAGLTLSLFVIGVLFGPLIPSATAKAVLGASIAFSLADAMGYETDSDGRAGLFLASFFGFSIATPPFLSGSVFTYTLNGVLPEEVRSDIGWTKWFLSGLPWLVVCLGIAWFGLQLLYGKAGTKTLSPDHVQGEIEKLGSMDRREKAAAALLGVCVLLWIFERQTGIGSAAVAVAAMAICFASGLLDPAKDLRTAVPWGLFLYLGVVLNLGNIFAKSGVNEWLKSVMVPLFDLFHSKAAVIMMVGVVTILIRFLIVSHTACIIIEMAVLLPVAEHVGVNPFVLGFVVLVTQQVWFTKYQNVVFEPARVCMRGTLAHSKTVKACFLYVGATLVACLISIPYWKFLGYL